MSTDLCMLVLSSIFTLVLAFPPVIALVSARGIPFSAGNRHESVTLPDWGGRAVRTHRNMIENIAPFAALVLVAHVMGVANSTTALGATLFFWGRVAHAVLYLAGVPYLRTLAFGVSFVGMLTIAQVILSA
jgi:uncharacterized MAPEG superfamily protein